MNLSTPRACVLKQTNKPTDAAWISHVRLCICHISLLFNQFVIQFFKRACILGELEGTSLRLRLTTLSSLRPWFRFKSTGNSNHDMTSLKYLGLSLQLLAKSFFMLACLRCHEYKEYQSHEPCTPYLNHPAAVPSWCYHSLRALFCKSTEWLQEHEISIEPLLLRLNGTPGSGCRPDRPQLSCTRMIGLSQQVQPCNLYLLRAVICPGLQPILRNRLITSEVTSFFIGFLL